MARKQRMNVPLELAVREKLFQNISSKKFGEM